MEELDDLARDLFQKFSLVEYSLKATGFHNGDGPAEPNWRNFALRIEDDFSKPDENLKSAIDYILKNPPKKQMIKDGLLEWKESSPSTDSQADLVLLYVRRVRNNLFHGGKFNGHWFDPPRSKDLLTNSLVILDACLAASDDLREAFEN